MISSPSVITNDIVRFVQESELCIVDLTGHNPNVFYECGRRHETGRPTIQLVAKADLAALPFDVAGIRTIPYELLNPRNLRDTVELIREYVRPFEASGYIISNSGVSLGAIAESIDRLERSINRKTRTMLPVSIDDESGSMGLLVKPKNAIMELMQIGNLDDAETIFHNFRGRMGVKQLVETGFVLSAAGSRIAKDGLIDGYDRVINKDNKDIDVYRTFGPMVYCERSGINWY